MHLKIKTESKNALFFLSHNRNKSYEQAENTKDLSGSLGGWLTASNELCTLLLSGPHEFSFWALAWARDCVQKEGAWFLPSSFVRRNAKDSWGQQSLKLRLCKAAKTQVTGKQVETVPAFSRPTPTLYCSKLRLSPDFSSQNSECLWIPLTSPCHPTVASPWLHHLLFWHCKHSFPSSV